MHACRSTLEDPTYGSPAAPISNVLAIMGQGDDSFSIVRTGTGTRNPVTVTVQGGPGNDRLSGGLGKDSLSGDAGTDVLTGGDGDDTLIGGDGDDRIKGGAGHDTILGDSGLATSTGEDVIDGGDGDDLIYPHNGRDIVTGGAGNDSIQGEGQPQSGLSNGPDFLDGGLGKDSISGSTDGDVIIGGIEPTVTVGIVDYIDGKGGDDCIIADAGFGALPVPGQPIVCTPLDPADGIAERDSVRGGKGSDLIYGQAGNDYLSGDDQTGTDLGDDVIHGSFGDDELHGSGGNDHLIGGVGDDELWGETGDDSLDLGPGDDSGRGGAGADRISGGEGDDLIYGYAATNTTIPDGADELDGGDGVDTIAGGPAGDVISGGDGNDTLTGDDGDDTIAGGLGDDTIDAGTGDDRAYGDDGHDKLTGRAGDDLLDGGAGDDLLAGDQTSLSSSPFPDGTPRYQSSTDLTIAGVDTLVGGPGNNLTWDTELATPRTERQLNLTLQITQAASRGITNGGANGFSHLPTSPGADEIRFNLLSNGVIVNSGRLVISPLANRAPVAGDDVATTDQGEEVSVAVLGNDTDPDGDPLRIEATSGSTTHGAWQISSTGVFRYEPATAFVGTETVTYTVRDRFGLTATATVTISVVADAAAPLTGCYPPAGWSATEVTVVCEAADDGVGLADPADAERTYTTATGAGHEGPYTIDPTPVCDAAGNCADEPAFVVLVDRAGPTVESANDGITYNVGALIVADVSCADAGSGLAEGTCADGQTLPNTVGEHSFTVEAVDVAGNRTERTFTYTVAPDPDTTPPTVDCDAPEGWQAGEVTVTCTATDTDSGLADPTQAVIEITTTVGAGNEAAVWVDPPVVCDAAGNCTDPAPIQVFVDRKAPTVTSANDQAVYTVGQVVTKDVHCADGGSGLAAGTCAGHGTALDTSKEGTWSFTVTAQDIVGNVTTTTVTYVVKPSGPVVSIGDASVIEGNRGSRTLRVPVTLSAPARRSVTVTVTVAAGTATAGEDYTQPRRALTVTIPAGRTLAYASLTVRGDTAEEKDETVDLTITKATNAAIGRSAGTATILDDDAPVPGVSVGDVRVVEGDSGNRVVAVTVALDAALRRTATVTVEVDGLLKPIVLRFRAGETVKTVDVTVAGDRVAEVDQQVTVRIAAASGVTVVRPVGTVTVIDDDRVG